MDVGHVMDEQTCVMDVWTYVVDVWTRVMDVRTCVMHVRMCVMDMWTCGMDMWTYVTAVSWTRGRVEVCYHAGVCVCMRVLTPVPRLHHVQQLPSPAPTLKAGQPTGA